MGKGGKQDLDQAAILSTLHQHAPQNEELYARLTVSCHRYAFRGQISRAIWIRAVEMQYGISQEFIRESISHCRAALFLSIQKAPNFTHAHVPPITRIRRRMTFVVAVIVSSDFYPMECPSRKEESAQLLVLVLMDSACVRACVRAIDGLKF